MNMKQLKTTTAGDVLYMHPEHGVFNPGNFAIVVRNDARGVRVLFVDPVVTRRVFFTHDDEASQRACEIVSMKLAASCEGHTQRDVGACVSWLRNGGTFRTGGNASEAGDMKDRTDLFARMVNAFRSVEPFDQMLARQERADIDPTLQGTPFDEQLPACPIKFADETLPTIPRMVDPGPIAMDDRIEGDRAETPEGVLS